MMAVIWKVFGGLVAGLFIAGILAAVTVPKIDPAMQRPVVMLIMIGSMVISVYVAFWRDRPVRKT